MAAGKYNLKLEQGAKWGVRFTWQNGDGTPVDLTGYTAKAQFRETKEATDVIYDSTSGPDIVLGGVEGTVDWAIDTATTTAFDFDTCFYDLELTLDDEVTRFVEGRVYLSREITK